MNVSLYDLLDVDESASADEIRAAWKAAIADLDPTDRRFRAFNDAAGVLLDEDKRAAYDAELAAGREDEAVVEDTPAEPVAVPVAEAVTPAEPAEPLEAAEPVEPEDEPEPASTAASTAGTTAGPPAWALFAAAGVAVVSIVLLIIVLTWPGSLGGTSPADKQERAEKAVTTAEDAAAAAVPVVLSYDYRTIDEDFAAAEDYLTDEFAAKRTTLFEQEAEGGLTLREQVVADKVVVTALVSGTGITRVSEDGSRATVVVYVDQDSQKGNAAPRSLRMWATLSMVADGDEWLLDDICTEDDCS